MMQNSVSIFETIDAVEAKTGLKAKYEEAPERESDHIWWISDMSRFRKDYPQWGGLTKDLDYIFNELLQSWIDVYGLKVKLKEKDYFRRIREK